MKAAEVRIRKALELGESYVDPTFVLVETTLGDDGETVTTIEHLASHIVERPRPLADRDVRPIGPAVARGRARVGGLVRGSRDIPIVYERDDSPLLRHAAAPNAARPPRPLAPSK